MGLGGWQLFLDPERKGPVSEDAANQGNPLFPGSRLDAGEERKMKGLSRENAELVGEPRGLSCL